MIFLLLLLALTFPPRTYAITTDIQGTVKINVCGDSLVELPAEDCEDLDLNGGSCDTIGYASGSLSCDIACSYDTTACIAPTPAPTPSVSPITTPSSSPSIIVSPASPELHATPAPINPLPIVTQLITSLPQNISSLVEASGLGGTTNLTLSHLERVIGTWVTEWKQFSPTSLNSQNVEVALIEPTGTSKQEIVAQCDINNDAACNLTDLSVILFYFNR